MILGYNSLVPKKLKKFYKITLFIFLNFTVVFVFIFILSNSNLKFVCTQKE